VLRRRYPRGHFWSSGKFYRGSGDADAETVIQYVRYQRLEQTSLDAFPFLALPATHEAPSFMAERTSQIEWDKFIGRKYKDVFF
jgi:hypothetical protein